MTREDALKLVGLERGVEPADIEAALAGRLAEFQRRRDEAPTETLREKYIRQITELEAARDTLLLQGGIGAGDAADLPVAEADETADLPTAAPSGSGLGFGPRIGQTVDGRFRIEALERRDGVQAVFAARDLSLGKPARLRVLDPQVAAVPGAREIIRRIAALSFPLDREFFPVMLDAGMDGAYFFSATVPGGTLLDDHLRSLSDRRTPMNARALSRLGADLAGALGAAEQLVGPLDGPAAGGVIVGPDGEARLDDVLIAAVCAAAGVAREPGLSGQMSPELRAGGPSTPASRQFAVAALVYQAATGAAPAGVVAPLHQVRRDLPAALCRSIDRALSAAPGQRFRSLTDFAAALGAGSKRRAGRTFLEVVKARRILAGVSAGVVLLGVGIVIGPPLLGSYMERQAGIAVARQDVIRLNAENEVLQDQIRGLERQLGADADRQESAAERLQGQIRSARTQEDRRELEAQLQGQQAESYNARLAATSFQTAFDHRGAGMAAIQASRAAAQDLQERGRIFEARDELTRSNENLRRLASIPDEVDAWSRISRDLRQLQGQWRFIDDVCNAAFNIDVLISDTWVAAPGDEAGFEGFGEASIRLRRGPYERVVELTREGLAGPNFFTGYAGAGSGSQEPFEFERRGNALFITNLGERFGLVACP